MATHLKCFKIAKHKPDKFTKVTYSGDAHHDQHNICLMEAVGKEIKNNVQALILVPLYVSSQSLLK